MASVTIWSDFRDQIIIIIIICHCFHFFPFYLSCSNGTRCHNYCFFEYWVLSQFFHSLISPSSRGPFVPFHFLPLVWFSSVHFSHSGVSNSLRPHEPQHARPLCPSPIPGVHPNPCPLSQWCHPTISSSVIPFSSFPQSFSAVRVCSNELALHIRWPNYWSFRFKISPGCSLEGLMLKLKLQYFGHLMQRNNSLEKILMVRKIEGRRRGQQRKRCWMASPTQWTWVWASSGRW